MTEPSFREQLFAFLPCSKRILLDAAHLIRIGRLPKTDAERDKFSRIVSDLLQNRVHRTEVETYRPWPVTSPLFVSNTFGGPPDMRSLAKTCLQRSRNDTRSIYLYHTDDCYFNDTFAALAVRLQHVFAEMFSVHLGDEKTYGPDDWHLTLKQTTRLYLLAKQVQLRILEQHAEAEIYWHWGSTPHLINRCELDLHNETLTTCCYLKECPGTCKFEAGVHANMTTSDGTITDIFLLGGPLPNDSDGQHWSTGLTELHALTNCTERSKDFLNLVARVKECKEFLCGVEEWERVDLNLPTFPRHYQLW